MSPAAQLNLMMCLFIAGIWSAFAAIIFQPQLTCAAERIFWPKFTAPASATTEPPAIRYHPDTILPEHVLPMLSYAEKPRDLARAEAIALAVNFEEQCVDGGTVLCDRYMDAALLVAFDVHGDYRRWLTRARHSMDACSSQHGPASAPVWNSIEEGLAALYGSCDNTWAKARSEKLVHFACEISEETWRSR